MTQKPPLLRLTSIRRSGACTGGCAGGGWWMRRWGELHSQRPSVQKLRGKDLDGFLGPCGWKPQAGVVFVDLKTTSCSSLAEQLASSHKETQLQKTRVCLWSFWFVFSAFLVWEPCFMDYGILRMKAEATRWAATLPLKENDAFRRLGKVPWTGKTTSNVGQHAFERWFLKEISWECIRFSCSLNRGPLRIENNSGRDVAWFPIIWHCCICECHGRFIVHALDMFGSTELECASLCSEKMFFGSFVKVLAFFF